MRPELIFAFALTPEMDVTIFDDDEDDEEVEEMVEEEGGVVVVEVVTDADLVVVVGVPVKSFTFATLLVVGEVTLEVGTLLELNSKASMPVVLLLVLGAVGHALVVT